MPLRFLFQLLYSIFERNCQREPAASSCCSHMNATPKTAWEGIFTHGHLEKGQMILIHGGAGAVGAYAVKLASHAVSHRHCHRKRPQ